MFSFTSLNDYYLHNELDIMTTTFSPDKYIKHIEKYIIKTINVAFTITEMECDEDDIENQLQSANMMKKWCIKFYEDQNMKQYINERQYLIPKYEIHILYIDYTETYGHSTVDFTQQCNVRSNFCHNATALIKGYMVNYEKTLENRYLERSHILGFILGNITNYHDFSEKDMEQVSMDKAISKKRNVLEDPMWIREVSQYLDKV